MTTPTPTPTTPRAQPTNGARPQPAAAPQPSPKQQAVTFAIELAKVRATSAAGNDRITDVNLLLRDARAIAQFLGGTTA